jgi:hypothetical protein
MIRLTRPVLVTGCTARWTGCALELVTGGYRFSVQLPGGALDEPYHPPGRSLSKILDAVSPDLTPAGTDALVDSLVRMGVLTEGDHSAALSGEYVAWRLVGIYRQALDAALRANPLIRALRHGKSGRTMQLGLLVESYHMVEAAKWTALPVLSHYLTPGQRALLTEFFEEEAAHGELLRADLQQLGVEVGDGAYDRGLPQTRAYANHFFANGHSSVQHFAAALIIPEVPQVVPGATGPATDILDLLHDVPTGGLLHAREHGELDDVHGHGELPQALLAESSTIPWALARDLVAVVRQTVYGLDELLRGVHVAYAEQGPVPAGDPLDELIGAE